MPNIIDSTGIHVKTRTELLAELTASLQTIYGADINLDQDTPDGQLLNIFIQAILDLEDLVVQTYNQFDPDLAIGKTLDERVAINGIQRQAGTYTITNVTIVTDRALNLYGLDQTDQPVYTVADNAGNQWQLISTITISGASSNILAFRAATPGENLTTPNTITVPVSVVLGVTSINNPSTYTSLGVNEESDANLKIRRQKSVSLASQGYFDGLLAALENINGILSAFVFENNTGTTDGDGIPGHSIWAIVAGTAAVADIAQAIYTKRNAGAGMKGAQTYIITQDDGSPFVVRWDNVEAESLWIKFDAHSLNGISPPAVALIKSKLVTNFVPGVNQEVNINALATAVQAIDPNTLVTNAGFSLTEFGSYTPTLSPSAKNKQLVLDSARINITIV